ncbi:MAG: c-type cytochrome [Myxococcota bacterium]
MEPVASESTQCIGRIAAWAQQRRHRVRARAGSFVVAALTGMSFGCTIFGADAPRCPDVREALAEVQSVGAAPAADPERGYALFAEHCATCHAPDRSARFFLFRGVPRLDCPAYASAVSGEYLFRVIADGGRSVGESRWMPGFADKLSSHDIASLVAYIRASAGSPPPGS